MRGVCRYLSALVLCAVGSVASAALFDGVISAWTFDDGTVSDSFGNNDGELRGGASFAPGADGKGAALDLNGTDSWAEIPHDASMDAMAGGLTAACWFFVRGNTQEFPSFMWKGLQVGWSPGFLFQLSLRNPNTIHFQFGSSTESAEGWFNYETPPVDDGEWHHAATIADGEEINGYFDGQELPLLSSYTGGSRPLALAAPYNVFPDQPIRMGMSQGLGANAFNDPGPLERKAYIDGMVDDAIIFSRALSQDEIQALMNTNVSAAVEPKGKLAVRWARLKTR